MYFFNNNICFHFYSPINNDLTLQDKLSLYYLNFFLCINVCTIQSLNLTTLRTNFQYSLKSLKNNNALKGDNFNIIIKENLLTDNFYYQSSIGEIHKFLKNINIEVMHRKIEFKRIIVK